MSNGFMDFLPHRRLQQQHAALARSLAVALQAGRSNSNRQREQIEQHLLTVLNQVASQALVVQAMLEYMQQQPGWDQARFDALMHTLDSTDGTIDGKLGGVSVVDLTPKAGLPRPRKKRR